MEPRWDGAERRRGQPVEQLREHVRELRAAWDADHKPAPKHDGERTGGAVHRDNDEERHARVQAMLERLRVEDKPIAKAAVREKSRTDNRRKTK